MTDTVNKLEEAFLNRHEKNAETVDKIYGDKNFGSAVVGLLADRLYEDVREQIDEHH